MTKYKYHIEKTVKNNDLDIIFSYQVSEDYDSIEELETELNRFKSYKDESETYSIIKKEIEKYNE
ncbi:MAG: hypothetical protein ACRCXZ_06910 [Patescibacteria group bacterium]